MFFDEKRISRTWFRGAKFFIQPWRKFLKNTGNGTGRKRVQPLALAEKGIDALNARLTSSNERRQFVELGGSETPLPRSLLRIITRTRTMILR